MSRTITAMFDSQSKAEDAAQQLRTSVGADPRIIDKTSGSSGSGSGEGRSFWDELKDLFVADEDRPSYEEGVRRGSFLLCAKVPEEQADRACSVLESSGAIDLDKHESQLRSQGFAGGAGARETGSQGRVVEEQRIPVVEERMKVGKREVERGGARVRSYVEEKPVHETVNLREEHVDVERRPVDQPISAAELDKGGLLKERTVEMRETAEEPVIGKDARVKEEVIIKKTADQRQENIDDKIHRTNVEVEKAEPRESEKEPGGSGRY
jgi:stress response protein YsnF